MEGPSRAEPFVAIIDDDRPHRVALLGGRRFGEPVPGEAIARHPSRAVPPGLLLGLSPARLAEVVELAKWRRPVTDA
jgi:hypothetical protein